MLIKVIENVDISWLYKLRGWINQAVLLFYMYILHVTKTKKFSIMKFLIKREKQIFY